MPQRAENDEYNSDYENYDLEPCLAQSKYPINLTMTIFAFGPKVWPISLHSLCIWLVS